MEGKTIKFGKNLVTTRESLAPGHNFCAGCGEALALRLALKALGENVIIANATGCIEICTSPLPIPLGAFLGCIPFLKTLLPKSQE